MKTIIALTILLTIICSCSAQANEFAVLVAGSNGFWNYRHQADICHAYKALTTKGIPASNIIVFSYNDAASDSSNPFPNKLFNKPSTGPGVDVNAGCKIDYEGANVTPTNYINVITGNATAMKGIGTGRVLTSTTADNVFIYFADHGGSGLIAFPSEYLYVDDFQSSLKKMNTNKMYKELVYYMEACESGSMWVGFPTNINIYALSAANQTESSWGTYCSPDDVVDGTEIGSCLGDLFSVNWMENTDAANTKTETLEQQFTIVEKETNLSHVLQWGQKTFTSEVIGLFEGETSSSFRSPKSSQDEMKIKIESAQDSRMIKLNYLKNQWMKDKENVEKKRAYLQEQNKILYFIQTFSNITIKANIQNTEGPAEITDVPCLKAMVENFEQNCMKFNEFGLKYVSTLAILCQDVTMNGGVEAKKQFVNNICKETGKSFESVQEF